MAVSCSLKHILYSSPAGAFTEYITRAPIGLVLPAGTVAQRIGRDLLVVVLHLLSNPSCRREVGASWTDVAVTLVAGIGGPAAEVAGLVARPLPLGEMAGVVAQLGCDRGLHQHVPLRVQSVPVVGGVNVLVDMAMYTQIYTYIWSYGALAWLVFSGLHRICASTACAEMVFPPVHCGTTIHQPLSHV